MTQGFQGDLKISIGPNGSTVNFVSGQPVMDRGIENMISLSLFVKKKETGKNQNGYWGNMLWPSPKNHVGSDYVSTVINQPLTLNGLANIEKAAGKALNAPIFGLITSSVTNPHDTRINNEITVGSPGNNVKFLALAENSLNWKFQAETETVKPSTPGTVNRWVPLKTTDDKFIHTVADEQILVKVPD